MVGPNLGTELPIAATDIVHVSVQNPKKVTVFLEINNIRKLEKYIVLHFEKNSVWKEVIIYIFFISSIIIYII